MNDLFNEHAVLRLWNTFSTLLTEIQPFSRFRALLKKQFRPKHCPVWYYTGKKRPNLLHTRLRLNTSSLNGDLYRNNLTNDPSCSCGFKHEDRVHYFMDCPLFEVLRDEMLQNVLGQISPDDNAHLPVNLDKKDLFNILLYGSSDLNVSININIAIAVQTFIIKTGRFARLQTDNNSNQ